MNKQVELIEQIQEMGINLVTCADCGLPQLTETHGDATCYSCGLTGDQADFPDLFYRGVEGTDE